MGLNSNKSKEVTFSMFFKIQSTVIIASSAEIPLFPRREIPGATSGAKRLKSKLICTPFVFSEAIKNAWLIIFSIPEVFISSNVKTVTPEYFKLSLCLGEISLAPIITVFLLYTEFPL